MITKPYDLTDAVTYHIGTFPPPALDYEVLLGPLEEAAASLARYDTKMSGMVNSELFLAPLRRQDAVTSSRMEGTISTIEELYRLEAEEDAGSTDPYREARNDDVETYLYSRALRNAQQALAEGAPLGEHLIRTAHQQLLSFGRGARKRPGSYKVEQNYIGDERRGKIYYVPIAPEQLGPAMAELVRYINESTMRPLIRTAIAHVEFEALHPFDGSVVIETTADFTQGASGGGLFDEAGRLIGLATFMPASQHGHNYAIPVDWIPRVMSTAPHGIGPRTGSPFWEKGGALPAFLKVPETD